MKRIIFLLVFIPLNAIYSQSLNTTAEINEKFNRVIKYYNKTNQKQKAKAASFLINNLHIHKSVNYKWLDKSGEVVSFSEFDYQDIEAAVGAFKVLKDSIELSPKVYEVWDAELLTPELMKKNIDQAFAVWQNKKWCKSYDFETFCEYILPYRSLVEPLEDWREEYQFLAENSLDQTIKETDPIEITSQVVLGLKDYRFLAHRPDPIPILSPKQLLFRRAGACPDLANLSLLAGRSIGLAVTFDFTPHYAASSNRHFWNSIIDKEGNSIPFNGNSYGNIDGLPYAYQPQKEKRIAKVFRKTYSVQKESLAFQNDGGIPGNSFLESKNIKDVTKEYLDVGKLIFPRLSEWIMEYAFLNVFNYGKWREVAFGKRKGRSFVFENLGKDIVYLPSVYFDNRMHYYPFPILLKANGESLNLDPNFDETFDFTFNSLNATKNKYVKENNSIDVQKFESYSLYVFDKRWKRVGAGVANSNNDILFQKIPSNALYVLSSKNDNGFERIFTINKETSQITWY